MEQRSHEDPLGADSAAAAVHDDNKRRLILTVNSLVLAAAIPALLRCSGGGDLLLFAWNTSLFAVTYIFSSMCFLSDTGGTRLANIFLALFYVGLLAFFARTLLSNLLGVLIMHLDSVLAAALFGATLAQHKERNGTETAALVAVANARATNKELDSTREDVYFLEGFMALCSVPLLVLMMIVDSSGIAALATLLGVIAFIQIIHMSCLVSWLNGAVITTVDADDDTSVSFLLCFMLVAILVGSLGAFFSEIVAITVLWLYVLASTAFAGYYHQIHASYDEIMSSEPATTTGEDSCSLTDLPSFLHP